MKRIILSIFSIGVVAVVALAATQAFFNDTETSTGNVLVAGALDLKIDNTCYYNGQACTGGFWGGVADNEQEPTNTCSCTWESKDLGEGDVFFNLTDLKPGDWEEDTISINVDNPSWLCADINITRDADNTCTEPETTDELATGGACVETEGKGELAENLYFVFWRDDGDNVFESDETEDVLTRGTADAVLGDVSWALADSTTGGGPIPAETTTYIGKFFCFGDVTNAPVTQGVNTPTQASGFLCNGEEVDNQSQTDSLLGDITFYAEQSRHNDEFTCSGRGGDQRTTAGALLSSYVQPSGDTCTITVTDGGTEPNTIAEGIAAASNGDTVCVDPGTYDENVLVNKEITLAGNGASATSTINGQTTGEPGALVVAANNVTVEGFRVNGSGVSAIRISGARTGVNILSNWATAASGQNAFLADSGQSNHLVQNNVFDGASSQIAYVNGLASVNVASTNVDFLNNTFAGTGNMALGQEAGLSDVKWNKFSTVTSFTDVEDWEGGNLYNFNNFNDTGLNLQHSENVNTGDNGITNAENNWWGDTDPSDGDVNPNVDVDFTPFELSAFPEN